VTKPPDCLGCSGGLLFPLNATHAGFLQLWADIWG
jgi:hypothetical protein